MEKRLIEPIIVLSTRLVKSEDLNHHGTLFAGRTAEWFVESGFISAASLLNPKNIVCLKIHGMHFTKPVKPGEMLKFTSKIIYTGKSSLVSYVCVTKNDVETPLVKGFITFINVNEETKPCPHNIEIIANTLDDKSLQEIAKNLPKN